MDFHHNRVRKVVEDDRLSSLPDDLIHKILSHIDMKYVVQTCSLSSRWKFVWTSMPYLNFSSGHFGSLPKFNKFVKDVPTHRNRQIKVFSVYLRFTRALNQVFVKRIANYAYAHNVQEVTAISSSSFPSRHGYPPCLFSSQSLKHFTLSNSLMGICDTPKTFLDFPALTTLNLSEIKLCRDLFSKCVNLKSLTVKRFSIEGVEVLDIITPRLSNLILIDYMSTMSINLVAPQLEDLTIKDCLYIKYLNAPPTLSSFCYTSWYQHFDVLKLSNEGFHSLNKVTISLNLYGCLEKVAQKTIDMLQELHSARSLTLNADTVECISSFPDLLSQHSSPFRNLICLTLDYSMRKDDKVTMPSRVINFLLENSPNATFIMKLPKELI